MFRTIDAQRLLVVVLWEAGIDSEEFTSLKTLRAWVAKEAEVSTRFVRRNVLSNKGDSGDSASLPNGINELQDERRDSL